MDAVLDLVGLTDAVTEEVADLEDDFDAVMDAVLDLVGLTDAVTEEVADLEGDFDGVIDAVLDLVGLTVGVSELVLDLVGLTDAVTEEVADLVGLTVGVSELVLDLVGLTVAVNEEVLDGVGLTDEEFEAVTEFVTDCVLLFLTDNVIVDKGLDDNSDEILTEPFTLNVRDTVLDDDSDTVPVCVINFDGDELADNVCVFIPNPLRRVILCEPDTLRVGKDDVLTEIDILGD